MNIRYQNFLFFCFHFSFLFFFYKISLLLFFTDRVLIRFRWPKHKKLIFIYTLHLSLNVFATITWRNSVSIIQHFNEGPLISISTLSSFPSYFFSLFPIPVEMANWIENYKETFYRGIGEEPKFHLVNWAQICELLQNGGLGVKNLRRFNQVLSGTNCGDMRPRKNYFGGVS